MIEWMDKNDPRKLFLKPQENVYFTEAWPIDKVRGKFFQIVKNKVLKRDVWKLIPQATSTDLDLTKEDAWIPETDKLLYEMNVTLKGNVLLYPKWPNTDYFLTLPKPGYSPNPADDTLRYLGCFDQDDIPFTGEGGILKIYTVKDLDPIRLTLYNDSIQAEKAVVRFMINICEITEIAKPPVFRKIQHRKELVF